MTEPVAKIPRLDEDDEQSTSVKIHPLLHPSLLAEECPLVEFRILRLSNKKDIGRIIKVAPELPEDLQHLKRVDSNGRVAIQLAKMTVSEEFLKILTEIGLDVSFFEIIKVPSLKPKTRKQADWARTFWPTSFHPKKEVENLLNDEYFKDKSYVIKWSKIAREFGCIVVQKGELLAKGSSSSRLLGHPAMEMVDHLAKQERQGIEYLATDCDVFLETEPCAMCAMALVHARAARVFFTKKSTNGVLSEGSWQLQHVPSFNHHYKVFFVDFGQEEENVLCR